MANDFMSILFGSSEPTSSRVQMPQAQNAVSQETPSGYVDPWAYQGYYGAKGFIPSQDNGNWSWVEGAPAWAADFSSGFTPQQEQEPSGELAALFGGMPTEQKLSEEDQLTKDAHTQFNDYFSEGSGYWTNKKAPNTTIEYSPNGGYRQWSDNPTLAGKIMSGVTMAALGAMTGGAGNALGGLAGQAVGAALPTTMQTGLSTGDWGKALINGGTSALGSYLGGTYGKDLNSLFGISSTGPLKGLGSSLINAGTSAAGRAALGQPINGQNILSNIISNLGSSYIGNAAGEAVGDGVLGEIAKNVTGGISKETLKSLLQGKSPNEQQIIISLLMGIGKPVFNNIKY